jgi:tetratricopeptide (TPR) repeat protein
MDNSVKRKLKIVLIAFVIILIPLGYFVKNLIAIHIHDRAIQSVYMEPHIGLSEREAQLKAILEINKAIKIYKKNHQFYQSKTELYWELKDFKSALESCEKAEKYNENFDYLFYFLKSHIYYELKDYENALATVEKAIELNSDDVELIVFQGVLYEFKKDKEKALEIYEKALSMYLNQLSGQSDTTDYYSNYFACSEVIILNYIIDHNKNKAIDQLDSLRHYVKNEVDTWKIKLYKSFIYHCPVEELGMKKLHYDEKVKIINENYTDYSTLVNILLENNIYLENEGKRDSSNSNLIVFEINDICKTKAIELGFKVIY